MKTYAVQLADVTVTAHVVAESAERAAKIAWNGDRRRGESVVYQQEMEYHGLDEGGPTVVDVYELETTAA